MNKGTAAQVRGLKEPTDHPIRLGHLPFLHIMIYCTTVLHTCLLDPQGSLYVMLCLVKDQAAAPTFSDCLPEKPCGFFVCQFHMSRHISPRLLLLFHPNTVSATWRKQRWTSSTHQPPSSVQLSVVKSIFSHAQFIFLPGSLHKDCQRLPFSWVQRNMKAK